MNDSYEKELKILGVRIDNLSQSDIYDWLEHNLEDLPQHKFITTLNPEIILKGHQDKVFGNILNSADLNFCDGFGAKFAAWLKGIKIRARFTGVDLVDSSLKKAKEKNLNVLVVVSKKSLSSPGEIKKGIEERYNFKAQAFYWNADNFFEKEEIKSAEIVFVNFGAPGQEKFIFKNRKRFPRAKILAGVGGAFDFLTGKMKRAPKWMRKTGFEWFWRLIQEPKRVKRIWNAVFVFPCLVIIKKSEKC